MIELLAAPDGAKFPLSEVLRRLAYELLVAQPYEALISYEALTVALGLDPRTDKRARSAVLKAARRLLHDDRKKIVNVRTVGYRIVKPSQQVDVAANERRAALRRLNGSLQTSIFIASETLTPIEIARVMTEQARTGLILGMARRLGRVKELPPRAQLTLPSRDRLVDLFRRKARKEPA